MFILTGCAVFQGAPNPATDVVQEANAFSIYLTGDVLMRAVSNNPGDRNGMTPREWRDAVIAARLQIIDQRFQAFKNELRAEISGLSFGTDLAALGLTAASSLTSGTSAKALAAASTGVIGAGTAFNKDALYQQTLPAIFGQMDADRSAVLIRIRRGQLTEVANYSLAIALTDITAYERAGTLEMATATLTQNAANQAQENKFVLEGLSLATPAVVSRFEILRAYLQKLSLVNDLKTLSAIANVLQVVIPPNSDNVHIRGYIFRYLDQYINKPGATEADKMRALDDLAKVLKPYVVF